MTATHAGSRAPHERSSGPDDGSPGRVRILLTGATGFLGSHLLRSFVASGHDVVILTRTSSDTGRIADLLGRVRMVDVLRTPLTEAFADPVDVVVHVATSFGRTGEAPSDIVRTNVGFPLQLLEDASAHGARAFLNTDTFLARHASAPAGLEYYTYTKACFRECAHRFASARAMGYCDVQLEHVIGTGDGATKFVPALIRSLLRDEPVFRLTGGVQVRDFIDAGDVVRAYMTLIEQALRGALPRTVEVGSGQAMTLRTFVELVHDACGSRTRLEFGALPYRAGELMYSVADPAYLKSLGWRPGTPVKQAIGHIVDAERRASSASSPTAPESRDDR